MGCALSHRGLASTCDTLLAGWGHTVIPPGEQQASVLAFLPFSHVYGLVVQGLAIRGGMLMGHEPELNGEALSAALRTFRPTYLCAVPSIFEKIYKNFLRTAQQAGRGALFERAADTARDFAAALERQRLGGGPGPRYDLRLQHALYERTVYRKLRAALGGRVCRATSAGSSLNRELSLFYEGIGIYVNDAYGLTETCGGVTAPPPGRELSGTVGKALPGMDIRVADDGEILVRGPSVFQGYVNDEAATRAALRGGWLATGDLGRLDSDGYLTITGRKKDVIITSGGKSVSPAPRAAPEDASDDPSGGDRGRQPALRRGPDHPGPGLPGVLARLLAVRSDARIREAREENALREELGRAVAAANSAVSRAESIRVFRVLPAPFDVASGLLTPSMKLRRDAIVRHYALQIDAMYQARSRVPRDHLVDEPAHWDDADNVFG